LGSLTEDFWVQYCAIKRSSHQLSASLIHYDGNRQNNFTLIRIVLAWSVLYGHSYAVQKTTGFQDPLNFVFQGSVWIGALAVNGFFAISGYLVAASFVKRGIVDYTISRILRIFPALTVCVFASVFILGPLFTKLSLAEYFSSEQTYRYLTNALAYFKTQWYLPGMFSDNSLTAVNGSLWTLAVEVRCYIILGVLGVFGLLKDRTIANFAISALLLFGVFFFVDIPMLGINEKWARPASYFLIGVFFFINRDKVILDFRLALFALILAYSSFGKEWFTWVFPVAYVYLIFYTAYATKFINTDGKLGDISYGVYIYAWPAQQIVVSLFPNFTPYLNTVLASLIVIPTAYLSWHYLEKPMLMLKPRFFKRR
jgi:peptidoglycan/LPS O-acetylase OafA/YrhL